MSLEIKLPELGEGIQEGELIKWLVKPGDKVKSDQAIAEIMTDKATVEVPSPNNGVIKELRFKEGDVIRVDSVILSLDPSEASPSPAPKKQSPLATNPTKAAPATMGGPSGTSASATSAPSAPPSPSVSAPSPALSLHPPIAESTVLATPATRRLARELGVDINQILGTGLAGRVTQEDVLNSNSAKDGNAVGTGASAPPSSPSVFASAVAKGGPTEERIPLRGIRKKIAENLQMAKQIIPHFTLMDEANVTALVAAREGLKEIAEKNQTKITYLPFVMKALVATMREFPMFNASIDDQAQEIVYKRYYNIGFAADTPNGLVVPVVKAVDQKNIIEISREILDLSKRARDGKLRAEEMKGATVTITNIGSVGGTYATPIINHPEVAILGMYKIQDKLVLQNGAVSTLKTMNFTITADHRLIDGAVAANFLKSFISKIENPTVLLLSMY